MTNLTIELAPELYERLQHEARRQGKAEQILAQELLVGQLLASPPIDEPLYVQMLPQIRALVAGKTLEDFAVAGQGTPQETIALLRSWTEEDDEELDEGDESWEDVLRSIDANRTSYRKLFPDLEQPQ